MSRILPMTPIPVVVGEDHMPLRFEWDGRTYPIRDITNRWRIDREWWRPERISRDYYIARTVNGLVAALFCDRLTDEWYLQRLYG